MISTARISPQDYEKFEGIYNKYAPKLFGFIRRYAETKEQAEQYLQKIFEQVAKDLSYFELNTEKKLLNRVLLICKPLLKSKQSNYSTAI